MSHDIEVSQPFAALKEVREKIAGLSAFDLSAGGRAVLLTVLDQLDDAMVFAVRRAEIEKNDEVQRTLAVIRSLPTPTPIDRLLWDLALTGDMNKLAELVS